MDLRPGIAVCCLLLAGGVSADFTNDGVRLAFDAQGRLASLQELDTGRELIRRPLPFVQAILQNGRRDVPSTFRREGSRLIYTFPDASEIAFAVAPFQGGWTFTIADCTHTAAQEIVACDLALVCSNYVGDIANMFSDDASGVCLRAYDLPMAMLIDRPGRLWTRARRPFAGLRFGLVAGPRSTLQRRLQAMTRAAGVPVNECGGAWALGAEANRGSYLQPVMEAAAVGRWIDLAERGGFTTIHLRRWMDTYGHYEPRRSHFPRGWDDLFAAVRRIRAAGLKVGVHTLTACISPTDPWVASEMNRDLIPWCSYTLAADLPPDASELEVAEPPKTVHDTSMTYFGNGNAMRLGSEIVQYAGFTRTPPYRYTGLKRGAFGTRPAPHAKGSSADYLQQRYMAFYPRPDSPLADALAARIAWFVNEGHFDQIYLDGAEGMMSRSGTDAMRRKIFSAIGRSLVVEASCQSPHSWWQHSRGGAWDGPNFNFKPFVDLHASITPLHCRANMLEPQMGWWLFRDQWLQRRGQFTDDVECFAARNAGLDAAMSFMEVDVNRGPLALYRENAVTILGRYERFRLARAFRAEVQDAFRTPSREFRLRQDSAGVWRVHPVSFAEVSPVLVSSAPYRWSISTPSAPCTFEWRIEPLYSNRPYGDPQALDIFAASTNGVTLSAAPGVSAAMASSASPHGDALAVSARNTSAPRHGSWVKLARRHAADLAPGGRRGLGLWVKGDGSGAILDLQLRMPRQYGGTTADYIFTIDFTGWRYLETSIRERMPAEAMRWTWDEPIRSYTRYLSELNMLHLAEVDILLNNLPTGRDVELAFTAPRMMHTFDTIFKDAVFTVDSVAERMPFAVKSGEYATREADAWRHWSVKGDLLASVPATPRTIGPADGELSFSVTPPQDAAARVRICTFAVGEGVPALRDGLPPRGPAAYEAEVSALFDPAKGCTALPPVRVRPDGVARVEFRFVGPVRGGALTFGGKRLPVRDLAPGEEFLLHAPDTCAGGSHPVKFEAQSAACRIGAVKRYIP